MAKLKSESEQEKLLLEKKHGAEMETVLEKVELVSVILNQTTYFSCLGYNDN